MNSSRSPDLRISLFVFSSLLTALPASADAPLASQPFRVQHEVPSSAGVTLLRSATTERVKIPSGKFFMGSDPLEMSLALASCQNEPAGAACKTELFADEYPPHEVHLHAFQMQRREVTVEAYERCVGAGVCSPPWYAAGGKRYEKPTFPVTMVAWEDAATYCRWVGGRLPTESEWERAARGTTGRTYPWGNVYDPFILNGGRFSLELPFEDRDGFEELAPVGSFPDGRTPEGIDDLAGNVEEWVADYYGEYPGKPTLDPTGPKTGDERVVRGGSFGSGAAWQRGAMRGHDFPSARRFWRGFRCAWADTPE